MLFRAVLLLFLLSVVTGGAASAVDEDDNAWSACWTSFKPPVCETEDVDIPKVGCYYEPCHANWSLCSVKRPEFRHSVGVSGYARGWATRGFYQIPTMPDFVQVLDLSSTEQVNLWNDIFDNVTHITGLILENTDLEGIVAGSLSSLKNLTCINMDNNPKLAENNTYGDKALKQLFLLPSLRRLSARNCNLLFDPPERVRWYLKNTNLISLWLSGNELSPTAGLAWLEQLVGLRSLDVSNCNIKDPYLDRNSILIPKLMILQTLNLSNNHLGRFLLTWYNIEEQLFPQLTVLDLSYNHIVDLRSEPEWTGPSRLEHVNLSHNSISVISHRPFSTASRFEALRHLDLSSQNVPTVDAEATILQIPSLLSLNLENKRLTFNTQHANASNNEFSKEHSELRELYISGNALRQFNEQKLLDLLGHLHDLETLSLANSRLDFVSATVFSNFPKLRVLILRDNAINVIPEGCFDPLTVLSHLDLSNNKIIVISHRTFGEGLRARLDFLDLGQNPIVCSCDLLWFRDWFMADSKLFSVSDPDYQCHNTLAKTQLADFTMHQQACLLSREVNEVIIFVCSFLTITSTAAVLLFRYRWHLRLLLYEVFRGRPAVRAAYLRQNRFDYDVFVSYAHEDLAWVRGRLVPELEGRLGLRLCIHDTHFIPGKPILHNIVDSVEKSKKVLMVFSKDFARSPWCQFELTTCLEHVMDHEDSLIIVCADDVTSHHTMTSAMMAVLRTTTYLQWGEGEDAVRAFWGRLEQALQEILHQDQQQYV